VRSNENLPILWDKTLGSFCLVPVHPDMNQKSSISIGRNPSYILEVVLLRSLRICIFAVHWKYLMFIRTDSCTESREKFWIKNHNIVPLNNWIYIPERAFNFQHSLACGLWLSMCGIGGSVDHYHTRKHSLPILFDITSTREGNRTQWGLIWKEGDANSGM
jgi:hypothetical protein